MKADSKASIRFEAFCLGGEECLNDDGRAPAGLGWLPPRKRFDTGFENVAECSIKLCRKRVHDKAERRSVGRSVGLSTYGGDCCPLCGRHIFYRFKRDMAAIRRENRLRYRCNKKKLKLNG